MRPAYKRQCRLFRNELQGLLRDTLLDDTARSRGMFRPEAVERLINEHQERRFNHDNRLWSLLILELWQREWMDA